MTVSRSSSLSSTTNSWPCGTHRSNGVHKCSLIQLLLLLIFSLKYSMTLTPRYPLSSATILKTTIGQLLLLLNLSRLAPCYMTFNNHQASTCAMVNVSQVPNFQGLIFDPSDETFDIIFL
ncbi:hypothetical protein NP493_1634g00020 [Ridgeia piscesae]|uniref:Uncharacterized protein n=1 Tax=Ridgeia piscesae TaxID=27915 RepID=A0AAD9NA47_RIDPI|nr:hypothetical protein NP493_1634g00020 [Ridgeia piscesae]